MEGLNKEEGVTDAKSVESQNNPFVEFPDAKYRFIDNYTKLTPEINRDFKTFGEEEKKWQKEVLDYVEDFKNKRPEELETIIEGTKEKQYAFTHSAYLAARDIIKLQKAKERDEA